MCFQKCPRRLMGLAVCLLLCCLATRVGGQEPDKSKSAGATAASQIENRKYQFKEAGKEMEYALFVPSKYSKDKKSPLIVALHGLGGNPRQMMRSRGLTELAEQYGYLVAAPMGYNSSGWYGSQGTGRGFTGAGRGRTGAGFPRPTPPGTVLSTRAQEELKLTDEQKKQLAEIQQEVDAKLQKVLTEEQNKQLKNLKDTAARGFGGFGGDGQDSPENLGELSEKDVMNVLAEVRKAFSVDEKRIYLIGHSMGGAGTYHLGAKFPEIWAGLAPIAAASGQPRNVDKLKNIPVIVLHGDNDTAVPVASARRWVERLKEQKIDHEYVELAGTGHGDVVGKGMPKIFEFFEKHKKASDAK